MAQTIVVALLVAACALYAVWTLMPAAARRKLAAAALPEPPGVRRFLRPYAKADSGCGCSGCDRAEKPGKPVAPSSASGTTVAPITFHKRR